MFYSKYTIITILLFVSLACSIGNQEPTPSVTPSNIEAVVEESSIKTESKLQVDEAILRLDRTNFSPNEAITVHFMIKGNVSDTAWIGIIPTEIPHGDEVENDAHDLSYQYLDGQMEGDLTFTVPDSPGSYDFRMYDTDSDNGQEIAYVSFTVTPNEFVPHPEAELILSQTSFAPGDTIAVQFKALPNFSTNAWIGIVPSDIPHGQEEVNDFNHIDYQYLDGQMSGELTFVAPQDTGSYDFRMHDTDSQGSEITFVTFQVE